MTRQMVPFRSPHYAWLAERGPAVDQIGALATNRTALAYLETQNMWTFVADGEPIAVAGTMTQWAGRHIAWAHMSFATAPHMLWITQEARRNLATISGRLETTVRVDFAIGHRWAKLLGFKVESPRLEQYGPDGEDHVGYVRIN